MSDIKKIEILGPGCSRCGETYRVVRQVVDEANLDVEVIRNESVDRMVELGIVATPAVVVDGEVKIAGRIPTAKQVSRMLRIED